MVVQTVRCRINIALGLLLHLVCLIRTTGLCLVNMRDKFLYFPVIRRGTAVPDF